jgi:hypothetical protein
MSRAIVYTPDPNVDHSLPNLTAHAARGYNLVAEGYVQSRPRLAAGQRRTGVQFEDLGVVGQKTGVFMLDIFRPLLL